MDVTVKDCISQENYQTDVRHGTISPSVRAISQNYRSDLSVRIIGQNYQSKLLVKNICQKYQSEL